MEEHEIQARPTSPMGGLPGGVTPPAETKAEHWLRRGRELESLGKDELCAVYHRMGHVQGAHTLKRWRKEEIINAIVHLEWLGLSDERKAPEPVLMAPPCDVCGTGQGEPVHAAGGDHHYSYTHDPSRAWVPYRVTGEEEAS